MDVILLPPPPPFLWKYELNPIFFLYFCGNHVHCTYVYKIVPYIRDVILIRKLSLRVRL